MQYELYHHGILGMKWGIRRYQNKDGSLTEAGKKRYSANNISDDDRKILKDVTALDRNNRETEKTHQAYGAYKDLLSEAKINGSEVSKVFRKAVDIERQIEEADQELNDSIKLQKDLIKEWNKAYPNDKMSYPKEQWGAKRYSDLLDFYMERTPKYSSLNAKLEEAQTEYYEAVKKYFGNILGSNYNSIPKMNYYSKLGHKSVSSIYATFASNSFYSDVLDEVLYKR